MSENKTDFMAELKRHFDAYSERSLASMIGVYSRDLMDKVAAEAEQACRAALARALFHAVVESDDEATVTIHFKRSEHEKQKS